MRKFYVVVLFSLISLITFSQSFEGEISYVKVTHSDTLFYVYTVKDNFVRVDEFDKYKRATRSFIANLHDHSLMVINPNKHVYAIVETSVEKKNSKFEVIHTGNYKYIHGLKCTQWRVKNVEENTEVSYWVAGENFSFYAPMSLMAMSIDDSFSFFRAIVDENVGGVVPLLVENRTLLRSPKSMLSVVDIKHHKVDQSVFSVANYQKFENLR